MKERLSVADDMKSEVSGKSLNFLKKLSYALILFAAGFTMSAETVLKVPSYGNIHQSLENGSGLNSGYYREFMDKIAVAEGWSFEYVKCSGTVSAFSMLRNGELDFLYGVYKNDERLKSGLIYSKYPCGTENLVLLSRQNDDRYNISDLSCLNGATIGFETGNPYARECINQLSQEYDITLKPFYFESLSNALEQLEFGNLDLCLANISSPRENEKILYNCMNVPIYFVSLNAEIINMIDSFLEETSAQDPFFYNEIFMRSSNYPVVDVENITSEEKNFVVSKPNIKVYFDNNPKDEDMEIVRTHFWHKISSISGLDFNYGRTPPEEPKDGELHFYEQLSEPQKYPFPVRVSHPVYSMNVRLVCSEHTSMKDLMWKDKASAENIRIAISPDLVKIMPYFADKYRNFSRENVVVVDGPGKAIQGTASGKYDACLVNEFYLLQKYSISDYASLKDSETSVFTIPVSIVVSGTDESQMDLAVSVINKTLSRLPYDFFGSLQTNQGLLVKYEAPWENIFFRYLVYILLVIAAFIAYTILMFVLRSREYKLQSRTDYLTGLLNMRGFEENALHFIAGTKKKCAVTEFNVRDFALINKNYGPEAGDRLIFCLSEALNKKFNDSRFTLTVVRKAIYSSTKFFSPKKHFSMNVGRNNGDTFLVIQEVEDSEEKFIEDLKQFQKQLQKDLCRCMQFSVVVKSGTAFSSEDEKSDITLVRTLLDNAAYARVSKSGSMLDNVTVFDQNLKERRESEEKIDGLIEKALRDEEFYVVYQPKVNPETNRIQGAEALVRWSNNSVNSISPEHFVSALERNGYIAKLDFYVYRKVFEYIKSLIDRGIQIVPVSLNVSRLCFDTKEFVVKFIDLFSKYDIPASYIELEIEERLAGGATSSAIKEMTSLLSDYGFKISMDDFGSGESSLNMLGEIPVDVIKVDKGFLRKAESSENSHVILESVIGMSKKMGKTVVCEGVETFSQKEMLRKMGCDLIQGYYYSKPLCKDDFTDYLLKNI